MWTTILQITARLMADKKTRNILLGVVAGILVGILLLAQMFMSIAAAATIGQYSGGGMLDDGNFYYPLELPYQTVSSHFNPARYRQGMGYAAHNGTDFPAPEGTPIHSSRGGKVTMNEYNNDNGNFVVIDHGNGIETIYKHMCVPSSVEVGQELLQLAVIGGVGNTGDSEGNHLHFEIRVNGVYIDAYPELKEWPEELPDSSEASGKKGKSGTQKAAFSFLS